MAALNQENVEEANSEREHLLQKQLQQEKQYTYKLFKFRLPLINDKGALFLIVWNAFLSLAFFSCATGLHAWETVTVIEYGASLAAFPFVGFIADCYIGRFKVLKVAQYLLLLAITLKILGKLVICNDYLSYAAVAFLGLAGTGYISTMLQFTLDQLIGASGEQLTFAIYWLIWGGLTTAVTTSVFYFFDSQLSQYLLHGLSAVSVLVAVIMMECCSHWLMKEPQLSNPFKHIAKVLNYARKHKYPQSRSAFTYWEEDYPSRIDLGKDKYGGPFTVEEVEDVKTILRLIPFIMCVSMYMFATQSRSHEESFEQSSTITWLTHSSFSNCIYLIGFLSMFGFPAYQFIIYPIFYNYTPGILRRIGMAMCFMLLSLASSSVLQVTHANNTCMTINDTIIDPVNSYWQMVPNLSYALSFVIYLYSFMEFVMCQSPFQVKVIVSGILFACTGFFSVVGYFVNKLIQENPAKRFPGCAFYQYVINLAILLSVLFVYILAAKRYKFRKRNDIVPFQMFAENYFEKNNERERKHVKQTGG